MDTATGLLEAFRTGATRPSEALEASLGRIEEIDPSINAFRVLDTKGARAAAAEADRRWEDGVPCGPLDGLPISVKDTLMAEGFAFRQGSLATDEVPATESAPVVASARRAGAVVVGITTCSEYGSLGLTVSPLTGTTRNPHDLSKHSGGSSGGAAASVAARLLPLALASDAAGSVRIPAAFCGVVGFKPSGGLLPAFPRNVAGPLSSPGFIARSVADVALALRVAVQPDPRDVEAVAVFDPACEEQLEAGVAGLRVAFSRRLGYAEWLDPEVEALVAKAVGVLEGLGAVVEEVDPGFSDPEELIVFMLTMGYAHILRTLSPEQVAVLTPVLRERIEAGRAFTAAEFMAVQDRRIELGRTMARFHERYDLLVTPTLPVTAFDADETSPPALRPPASPRAWTRFVYPFNLTQQPALSLPCGTTSAGLPAAVQFVGPRRGDAVVLRAARAYEGAVGDMVPVPSLVAAWA